jgi:lipid II:glycine glycyltransferase (peptidoglycan interpeptide bridge formation enzyme)
LSEHPQETALEVIPLQHLEPGHELLQSFLWASLKQRFGWTPHAFRLPTAAGSSTLLTLARPTPFGRLAYVPYGLPTGTELGPLARAIARHARTPLVRFDLPWPRGSIQQPASKSVADVQPPRTVILDVAAPPEDLLARMKSKTRYNVRLAERHGVTTRVWPAAELPAALLDDWYEVHNATAQRHRITAHSRNYFRTLFQLARSDEVKERAQAPALYLLDAELEGERLAGMVVSVCGGQARYLYGASSDRHRNSMPNYALQWAAIRLAHECECATYDLYGIPKTADPDDPWHGLYRLKTGFGGSIVEYAGCWDVATGLLRYRMMRAAERSRQWYYHQLRPRLAR